MKKMKEAVFETLQTEEIEKLKSRLDRLEEGNIDKAYVSERIRLVGLVGGIFSSILIFLVYNFGSFTLKGILNEFKLELKRELIVEIRKEMLEVKKIGG